MATFAIKFEFTDHAKDGDRPGVDVVGLAEALFDHLIEGDYQAADQFGTWSIDNWEVEMP